MPFYRKFIFFFLSLFFLSLLFPFAKGDNKKKAERHVNLAYALQTEPDTLALKAQKNDQLLAVSEVRSFTLTGLANEGIDVSRYQGVINWEEVAQEQIGYVYLKATEGETLVDPTYRRNLTEAKKAGLKIGSYHFYRAHVDMDLQLKNLTSNIIPAEQNLLPMIDIEHTNGVPASKFIADLRSFILAVEKFYGKKPILYTFQNFYNKYLLNEFKNYQWMIAKYRTDEPVLKDNLTYVMWQYTENGRIKGIHGGVDRSVILEPYTVQDIAF